MSQCHREDMKTVEQIEAEAIRNKLNATLNRLRVATLNELRDYLVSNASELSPEECQKIGSAILFYENPNTSPDNKDRTERIRQYLRDALNQASSH